jgi:transposase InsO family protein
MKEDVVMDWRQEEALWRYSLIREPADARLSCGARGALVRVLAARLHAHPSGELRSVGRTTLDDWIRAYRYGGFRALVPKERASVPRTQSRPCGWRACSDRRSRRAAFLLACTPITARRMPQGSLRACARRWGIRLTHSTPGRPEGRGKIERFFRTLRQEMLVELEDGCHGRPPDLPELERMLQAWIERVYHRRVHTETKTTPLARFGGLTPRYPIAAELREAFCGQSRGW